ncbi:Trimethylguanosine synthase [Kappamyces sp. JEL0680]|nr:Trimethylguanosine synthase [Kappamyces sp. JEL0680]
MSERVQKSKAAKRRERKAKLLLKYAEIETQPHDEQDRDDHDGSYSPEPECQSTEVRKTRWKKADFNKPKYSHLAKYWWQRYSLFSQFDKGIRMDETGWFSVTPEVICTHLASRFVQAGMQTVIDGFAGVGGNSIGFALAGLSVIAVEIDETRLDCARHNARLYGVADKIQFIHGDFMEIAETLYADSVFLSPPWGGPEYLSLEHFDIEAMPLAGWVVCANPRTEIFEKASAISHNICYYLPRNTIREQVIRLAGEGGQVELEQTFVNDRIKCWSVYYGMLNALTILMISFLW